METFFNERHFVDIDRLGQVKSSALASHLPIYDHVVTFHFGNVLHYTFLIHFNHYFEKLLP